MQHFDVQNLKKKFSREGGTQLQIQGLDCYCHRCLQGRKSGHTVSWLDGLKATGSALICVRVETVSNLYVLTTLTFRCIIFFPVISSYHRT